MGANKPVAPASLLQVGGAGRVVGKKSLELWERLWEPKIATLVNVHEHGRTLPLVAVGDNRIGKIHPNVAGLYRRKVERLAEALQRPQERDEAAEALRALIDHITLTPGPRRGEIDATLHGDLGTILEWTAQKANTPGRDGAGVSVSVVAGARNHLNLLFNAPDLGPKPLRKLRL